MARHGLDASIPPSISNILQNLSSKPNVQSTLILSRKDGSIICATGELSVGKRANIAPPSDVAQQISTFNSEEQSHAVDADEQSPSYIPNPAESLASSIFEFVRVATALGAALRGSHNDDGEQSLAQVGSGNNATNGQKDDPNQDDEMEDTSRDSQVQLLRMRMKKQEIIIFPDLNYLCCVVQAVGKNNSGMR